MNQKDLYDSMLHASHCAWVQDRDDYCSCQTNPVTIMVSDEVLGVLEAIIEIDDHLTIEDIAGSMVHMKCDELVEMSMAEDQG